jgi:hypothetical protein
MATLEQLTAQRDALREAISTGVMSIRHEGKTLTYQSTSQMLAALNNIEARIRRAKGGVRRRYVTTTGKGL